MVSFTTTFNGKLLEPQVSVENIVTLRNLVVEERVLTTRSLSVILGEERGSCSRSCPSSRWRGGRTSRSGGKQNEELVPCWRLGAVLTLWIVRIGTGTQESLGKLDGFNVDSGGDNYPVSED